LFIRRWTNGLLASRDATRIVGNLNEGRSANPIMTPPTRLEATKVATTTLGGQKKNAEMPAEKETKNKG